MKGLNQYIVEALSDDTQKIKAVLRNALDKVENGLDIKEINYILPIISKLEDYTSDELSTFYKVIVDKKIKNYYDIIKKNETLPNTIAKISNIYSDDDFYKEITKVDEPINLIDLIKDKVSDLTVTDKNNIKELFKINKTGTEKSTIGRGEILLKTILQDCIVDDTYTVDIVTRKYKYEVKNLTNGSSANILGYTIGDLKKEDLKNINTVIDTNNSNDRFALSLYNLYNDYCNKHNSNGEIIFLEETNTNLNMVFMPSGMTKKELIDFLNANNIRVYSIGGRVSFKVK